MSTRTICMVPLVLAMAAAGCVTGSHGDDGEHQTPVAEPNADVRPSAGNLSLGHFRMELAVDEDGEAAGFVFTIPYGAGRHYEGRCEEDAALTMRVDPLATGPLSHWGLVVLDVAPTPVLAYHFGATSGAWRDGEAFAEAPLERQSMTLLNYVNEPTRLEVEPGEEVAFILHGAGQNSTVTLDVSFPAPASVPCDQPEREPTDSVTRLSPVGAATVAWWERAWMERFNDPTPQAHAFASQGVQAAFEAPAPGVERYAVQTASPDVDGWGIDRFEAHANFAAELHVDSRFHNQTREHAATPQTVTYPVTIWPDLADSGPGGIAADYSVTWSMLPTTAPYFGEGLISEQLQFDASLEGLVGIEEIGFSCGYYGLGFNQCGLQAQTPRPSRPSTG